MLSGRSPRSRPRTGKPSRGSEFARRDWNGRRSPGNTDASWPTPEVAKARVLRIQTKLHQWATDDPNRRFDDPYNLVYDPAVLVDAWTRVRSNRGARSAVKAFLEAGILSREGVERHPITSTPQGGIVSPSLSNLALSVLDEHFVAAWESFGPLRGRSGGERGRHPRPRRGVA